MRYSRQGLYPIVAKALAMTTMTTTAFLRLYAPTSLTAMASDHALLADPIAWAMLAMSVIGWADIIAHDVLGRDLLPNVPTKARHKGCVLFYIFGAAVYWIFAFAALGSSISPGAILISNYMLCGLCLLGLAGAIAQEDRRGKPP